MPYAVADKIEKQWDGILTPGKKYKLLWEGNGKFSIIDDLECEIVRPWVDDWATDGSQWRRVEDEE